MLTRLQGHSGSTKIGVERGLVPLIARTFALLAAFAFACAAAPPAGYVGSEPCKTCHADVSAL